MMIAPAAVPVGGHYLPQSFAPLPPVIRQDTPVGHGRDLTPGMSDPRNHLAHNGNNHQQQQQQNHHHHHQLQQLQQQHQQHQQQQQLMDNGQHSYVMDNHVRVHDVAPVNQPLHGDSPPPSTSGMSPTSATTVGSGLGSKAKFAMYGGATSDASTPTMNATQHHHGSNSSSPIMSNAVVEDSFNESYKLYMPLGDSASVGTMQELKSEIV